MKPDWSKAPKWAQWLAMDSDGRWVWYTHKPSLEPGLNEFTVSEGSAEPVETIKGWRKTREERPK